MKLFRRSFNKNEILIFSGKNKTSRIRYSRFVERYLHLLAFFDCVLGRGFATGVPGGTGYPHRLAKYPLWHPQIFKDFNISPIVPALPDFALAPSYVSLPVVDPPHAQISVATPLVLGRYYRTVPTS